MGEAEDLRSWERRALVALMGLVSTVMAVWAGIVYDTGQDVLREVAQIRAEIQAERVINERRLTIIEQKQGYVIETLRRLHWSADVPKGRGPDGNGGMDDAGE